MTKDQEQELINKIKQLQEELRNLHDSTTYLCAKNMQQAAKIKELEAKIIELSNK